MERRKGHLKGYQWRESPRALSKKERAKQRHFGDSDGPLAEENTGIISRDENEDDFGIISEIIRGNAEVYYRGKMNSCTLSPDIPFSLAKALVVGDHLLLDQNEDDYVATKLLERKTSLSRLRKDSTRIGSIAPSYEHVIAANVDIGVIVAAAKDPPLHPRFIDRYMVVIQHSGITPLICINKSDLVDNHPEILDWYRQLGINVVYTSAQTGLGIDELKDNIRGKTAVLVGNSGVGKSSLINAIDSNANLLTGEVSKKTSRGKHTTTSSSLRVWDEDSFIIDTPGIRSVGMWDMHQDELQLYFEEINQKAPNCRYTDCLHDNILVSLCAVKGAVEHGDIPIQRYESYIKILHEL